jgi:serine/threonine-protein kinase
MTTTDPLLLELQAAVAGRYAVDRELGRGGMGVVYLAQDVALLRPVAIKVLAPDLARQPEVRVRFLREARTVAALSHPNIVPVFAVEERGDLLFFVMAFVEGESLRERVQRVGALPAAEVTTLIRDIAWALGYAHGRGIIHRDVKPDNILIERATGRVLLTDFGIARRDSEHTLSGAGELVGTLQFMSPEQAADHNVDGRSDLYSLGLTAIFALSGALPVRGSSAAALLHQLLNGPGLAVESAIPAAPDRLKSVVATLVQRDPHKRPVNGESVAQALDATVERPVAPALRSAVETARSAGNVLGVAGAFIIPIGLSAFDTGPSKYLLWGLAMPGLAAVTGWYAIQYRLNALAREGFRFDEIEYAVAVAQRELREVAFADVRRELDGVRSNPQTARRDIFLWAGLGTITVVMGSLSLGSIQMAQTPFEKAVRFVVTAGGLLSPDFLLVRAMPWLAGACAVVGIGVILRWARRELLKIRSGYVEEAGTGQVHWMAALDPARVLISRLGRWTFERARRKLVATGAALPAEIPAATASETIAATHVLGALALVPASLRDRLGDVPRIAAALEAKGHLLRKRLQAAEAGLAAAPRTHPAHAQFLSLRDGVARRIGEVNAVLEAIRLDLLRAAAGAADAVTISQELEKAKELSAAIDAELHGQSEVKKLLG